MPASRPALLPAACVPLPQLPLLSDLLRRSSAIQAPLDAGNHRLGRFLPMLRADATRSSPQSCSIHESILLPQRHVRRLPIDFLSPPPTIYSNAHVIMILFLFLPQLTLLFQLLLCSVHSAQNCRGFVLPLPLSLLQRQCGNSFRVQQHGRCGLQWHQRQLLPVAARPPVLKRRVGTRQGENTTILECSGGLRNVVHCFSSPHTMQVVVCDGYPKSAKA